MGDVSGECYNVPALLKHKRVLSVLIKDMPIRVDCSYHVVNDDEHSVAVYSELDVTVLNLRYRRKVYGQQLDLFIG